MTHHKSSIKSMRFPVSQIRGKFSIGEKILEGRLDHHTYNGLVDDMRDYETGIDTHTIAPTIIDFYENTKDYRLFSEVKWHNWFKPFAACYRLISRFVKQINLPLSRRKVEMTGDILSMQDNLDGRKGVRAWVRKVGADPTFIALYSSHSTNDRTYMNIALPLPWSTMIGILELNQSGTDLILTSNKEHSPNADSGIYLAIGRFLFKLPLQERFLIKELEEGKLTAKHTMRIFSIPFLTIDYEIKKVK